MPRAAKGEWYFGQFWNITSRNTTHWLYHYLFIREAEKFSVTHRKPLFRDSLKRKTNKQKEYAGVCIGNNLFTSKKKNGGRRFFVKPVQTIEGKKHELVQWKKF